MRTPTAAGPRALCALDTIHREAVDGIPTFFLNIMEHSYLERLAAAAPGSYQAQPEAVYLQCQKAAGVCMIDQWIPHNPLSMQHDGFHQGPHGATTGAREIVVDGILIDSPEAVVRHLETVDIPATIASTDSFDADARVAAILHAEQQTQELFGPDILKGGYGFIIFPHLHYFRYGYENYFMAMLMYPEVVERSFSVQADAALLNNRAALEAIRIGGLPPFFRLDHDMADSRATLVDIALLERIWFPHFARCIEPLVQGGMQLVWHCDGNLMQMLPRLIDCGIEGFQGFQYEDGMDYARICSMRTRSKAAPLIIAGVSVTTTLPHGSPAQVREELRYLVQHGPATGLFLGASSSIAPGVPWENLAALVEGLRFYRDGGR